MTLPAVIFTYSGDAEAVPWAVLGAIQAGLVPVVAEDSAAPLPTLTRGWLARRGVRLWETHFPRRGNLNGTDCAAGICRILARAAGLYDGHALKLDTDTVVIRPGLFMTDPGAAMVALTCHDDRPGAYGMAYRLQGDTAAKIASVLESMELDETAPEDVIIYRQARLCGRVAEREFSADAGPFSAVPADADLSDFATRFDVVTVGNPPRGGWLDRPRQVAVQMRCMVAASRVHG